MTSQPRTTNASNLSSTAARPRRWGAWVAGLAVAAAALVTGCTSAEPAPAASGHDEVALNDRLDEIQGRAAAMRDKIAALRAKREKIDNAELPPGPKTPKTPKAPKTPKPPKPPKTPPPDGETGGVIPLDPKCVRDPIGCLKRS